MPRRDGKDLLPPLPLPPPLLPQLLSLSSSVRGRRDPRVWDVSLPSGTRISDDVALR